ncbi:MAG: hypothetical protein ACK5JK_04485 [Ignavibacteria bacterium]
MKTFYAGIDIGTNTLLLLILSKDSNGMIEIVRDEHRIARLGEGVHEKGFISDGAMQRAHQILQEYADILKQYESLQLRVVATSAMRDALNRKDVIQLFENILENPIEIISGEEEAYLTYLGSKEQYSDPLIIDIGGGSTECIRETGNGCQIISLNIGAVSLHETYVNNLPISKYKLEEAKRYIKDAISSLQFNEFDTVIATAGTPTTLAAMDLEISDISSEAIHGHFLHIADIKNMTHSLLNSSFEEILLLPGVHPQRADILPAGALILQELLLYFNIEGCIVSKKGLRFGVAYSIMDC